MRPLPSEEILDREDLDFGEAAVSGIVSLPSVDALRWDSTYSPTEIPWRGTPLKPLRFQMDCCRLVSLCMARCLEY